jgi:cobalamin biosynthetic protein CobC
MQHHVIGMKSNADLAVPVMHGGRLAEARRLFPYAPEPFLDLSTGINPVAYPLPPLGTEPFTRLPEPEEVEALETIAAVAYRVAGRGLVVAAPGTQILIDLLPRIWPVSPVTVLAPTYAEYARAWTRAGCQVACVADFAALHGAGTAVLCNPNNPDGRRIPRDRLLDLADRLAGRGGLLVIDEAFADLEREGLSLATALPHPAVIVLRSFGKTYGLAGLRLGFALAAPERATAIREALGQWAVSGPAIAIGKQALGDKAWLSAAAARLARDTQRLDTCLTSAGLQVRGGTALFRLAEMDDANSAFLRLGRAGIFVRRFREHPGWLRFGVPCRDYDIERLRLALRG